MDEINGSAADYRLHRRRFSRMGWAMAALLLVPLAVQLIPALIMYLMGSPLLTDLWFGMALTTVSLYLVGYPLAWFLLRGVPAAETEAEPLPAGLLIRALFIALAALYITNYLTVLIIDVVGSLRGTPVVNPVETLAGYPLLYNLGVSCILAPIAEEGLFRGLILNRLRPYGERFAVLASALTFAMMHGNLSQMLYAFTVGVVFGYVAVRTGQVRQTVILHACVNFIGGCLPVLLEQAFPEGAGRDMAARVMTLVVIFSIVMGIVFFLRRRRYLWLEQEGAEQLSEGRKWGLLFSSPGMIVYTLAVAVCVAALLILL